MRMSRVSLIASWALRLIAALILFQTLFFKFTGAPESVYIFTVLRMEPWGRYGSGLAELLACFLLLIPGTVAWGALLSLGLMGGAIASHLGPLGLDVMGDMGLLFGLALTVFTCGALLLLLHRRELPPSRRGGRMRERRRYVDGGGPSMASHLA